MTICPVVVVVWRLQLLAIECSNSVTKSTIGDGVSSRWRRKDTCFKSSTSARNKGFIDVKRRSLFTPLRILIVFIEWTRTSLFSQKLDTIRTLFPWLLLRLEEKDHRVLKLVYLVDLLTFIAPALAAQVLPLANACHVDVLVILLGTESLFRIFSSIERAYAIHIHNTVSAFGWGHKDGRVAITTLRVIRAEHRATSRRPSRGEPASLVAIRAKLTVSFHRLPLLVLWLRDISWLSCQVWITLRRLVLLFLSHLISQVFDRLYDLVLNEMLHIDKHHQRNKEEKDVHRTQEVEQILLDHQLDLVREGAWIVSLLADNNNQGVVLERALFNCRAERHTDLHQVVVRVALQMRDVQVVEFRVLEHRPIHAIRNASIRLNAGEHVIDTFNAKNVVNWAPSLGLRRLATSGEPLVFGVPCRVDQLSKVALLQHPILRKVARSILKVHQLVIRARQIFVQIGVSSEGSNRNQGHRQLLNKRRHNLFQVSGQELDWKHDSFINFDPEAQNCLPIGQKLVDLIPMNMLSFFSL